MLCVAPSYDAFVEAGRGTVVPWDSIELTHIYRALRSELGKLQFELPATADGLSLTYLKRFEDALDALVCAWVGLQHLHRRTRPYGDHESAIWVPTSTAASSAR